MKILRKQTIVITVTAIFIILVLFISNGVYGNPISAYFATQTNVKYIEKKYPEFRLEVSKAKYHAKFSEYVSLATSTSLPDVHFEVRYKNGKTQYDYYESDVLTGYNTEKRFGQERTNEIKSLLIAKYDETHKGRCFVEFDEEFSVLFKEGKVKINQPYNREFECNTKLFMDFSLETVTPQIIADHIIELNTFLIDKGYVIDEFIGNYLDSEKKGFSISISKKMIDHSLNDSIEKALSNRDSAPLDKIAIYRIQ